MDKKGLKEDDSDDDKDRGEIKAAEMDRQSASNGVKHRLGHGVEESDDGVIRVRIDPRDDCTADDNPHV